MVMHNQPEAVADLRLLRSVEVTDSRLVVEPPRCLGEDVANLVALAIDGTTRIESTLNGGKRDRKIVIGG
jgi:hypothetical protein